MKYTFLASIIFSSALLSMQSSQQDLQLQQKIAAARLHNRTHCPLARLPRDVQDMIAQHLEFNDRESDEEFIKNVKKPTLHYSYQLNHWTDALRKCGSATNLPTTKAEQAFIDLIKAHQPNFTRTSYPFIAVRYSRDMSKILMAHYEGYRSYFFIYDIRKNLSCLDFCLVSEVRHFDRLLAVSNDGKYYLKSSLYRNQSKSCELTDKDQDKVILFNLDVVPEMEFNKQSTKFINKKDKQIYSLTTEQEHKERSKKTLALYLHQKGICKPFDYHQESA